MPNHKMKSLVSEANNVIRGVYRNGVIVPLEEIPDVQETPVMIVFLENKQSEEEESEEQKIEAFFAGLKSTPVVPDELIGCGKSDKGDISSNKYKYLGKIE